MDRDYDLSRDNALDEYSSLTEDLLKDQDLELDKDIEIRDLERDEGFKSLYKEMDEETRDAFARADSSIQRDVLEQIKAGRMSLQEARDYLERNK